MGCLPRTSVSFLPGSLLLHVVVVLWRPLNEAFGTSPLTAGEWVMCVALASLVLWAVEAKKVLSRALRAVR